MYTKSCPMEYRLQMIAWAIGSLLPFALFTFKIIWVHLNCDKCKHPGDPGQVSTGGHTRGCHQEQPIVCHQLAGSSRLCGQVYWLWVTLVGCIAKILLNSVVFENAGFTKCASDTRTSGMRGGNEHGLVSGYFLQVLTPKANVCTE